MKDQNLKKVFGPLYSLYNDPEITEICVDSPDYIYYEGRGKIVDSDIKFKDSDDLRRTIQNIFLLVDRKIDDDTPIANMRLSDGTQVTAVFPPVSAGNPAMFIRKMQAVNPSWEDLIKWGTISEEGTNLINKILNSSSNVLITGNVGSGKTTVANLFIKSIPEAMRVISVESDFELQIDRKRGIRLEAIKELSVEKLIEVAKKLLPDYLVVNELKGAETMSVVSAMRSGHATLSTLHAESVTDALTRLELMCMMANLGIGINEIRTMVASAVNIVTYQEKKADGKRRIVEIAEVVGVENKRYSIRPLLKYNENTKSFEVTEAGKEWMQK